MFLVDEQGLTALILYVWHADPFDTKVVQFLVGQQVNVNQLDVWGETALLLAATFSRPLAVFDLLIEAGADVNYPEEALCGAVEEALNHVIGRVLASNREDES